MSKKLITLILATVALLVIVGAFKYGNMGTSFLWRISDQGTWLLPLVLVSAAIDSLHPCAFSILLLTIGFLFSMGKMRGAVLKTGGMFILGIFLVYVLIGLGIMHTLHLFSTPNFMAKIGATLLIIMGSIGLINELFPNFPIKLKIPQASHKTMASLIERASMPTAFVLGLIVGLCAFPCAGGPYLMVLGLLHDKATYGLGLGYLLLYNLIFILPLILILLIASNKGLLEKVQVWKTQQSGSMRLWGGLIAVALGILIFFL